MAADPSRIELKLEPDLRLAAAVGGAVSHVAERLGLDPGAQSEFAAAAEEACREALTAIAEEEARVAVVVEDYPDRIEVTVSHSVAAPETRRNTSTTAGSKGLPSEKQRISAHRKGVDRVLYVNRGGAARLTLIKYLARKSKEL